MMHRTLVNLGLSRVRDSAIPSPAITPRTTVGTALRLLREQCLPALPVFEGGRFLGLVDEKALLRLTPSEATTLDTWEMHDLLEKMTVGSVVTPAQSISPDASLYDAARLMSHTASGVLPVLEGNYLFGLLPWSVLVAATVDSTPAPVACA